MKIKDLIVSAKFKPISLQFPGAWVGHIPFASWLIESIKPKIFVELGVHSGNSYFAFCQSVAERNLLTQCFAVDTWAGDEHAEIYGEEIFLEFETHHRKYYSEFSSLLRKTFDEAACDFPDHSIDLLHIDGLHTYEAVRHDFETWLPKLAPGAIIMFHDTQVRDRNFGVWKLWEELQVQYPGNLEFVHSHGLGVLQLNNSPDNKKLEWLQSDSPEKQQLKIYFAELGSRQMERFELNELKQHASNLITAVAVRDGQIAVRDGQITERDGQIAERDGLITSLYNSNSWKITRPLRSLGHQIKLFLRISQLLRSSIKQGGGITRKLIRAFELYRREGIAGVLRGIQIIATSGQRKPTTGSGQVDRNDYLEWIRRYDSISDASRVQMRSRQATFVSKPLISVLMPTYNTKAEWLVAAIESVRSQIYPNWELCIADDASTEASVHSILKRYAAEDERIKVVFRKENRHISATSNSALELVSGDWIALFDHDDLLTEHALFWVANSINNHPDARLIYSDEAKIDEAGQPFQPYFKCDWNLDLFYSQNMFSHLGVYQTDLIREIGGFRPGFEGSQDYDLALRCIERIKSKQIVHIPHVLYLWRAHADSTAFSEDSKPYAISAGERSLNEHFERVKIKGKVKYVGHGYRVSYLLPPKLPLVTIIIPTRNGFRLLQQCIDSILTKTRYSNYEILIIDNGSDDVNTLSYLESLLSITNITVLRDESPFNYPRINNAAVKNSQGEIIALLNNDIEVISPDWLSEMVSHALRPGVGAVGAKLWYPDGTLQHGGVILGIGGVAAHAHGGLSRYQHGYFGRAALTQNMSAVTAACLVIQKSIFQEVGGMDEENLAVAFNDVDFCLRLGEGGYHHVWTPYAELYHHESATRGLEDTPEKQARFNKEVSYMLRRWGEKFLSDPAYSPNLTLIHSDFSLAWPPRASSVVFQR